MEEIETLLSQAREHSEKTGRPWVTLSYAQSLDGSIAARPGQPLALSGPQSLKLTHQLRAAHDAILVGIGTVLADNPRLTVRLVEGKNPQPIIVDSRLRFPLHADLLRGQRLSPWIATGPQADGRLQAGLERAGARVLRLPANSDGGVNLSALLDHLGELQINSLMVEGGARIITNFLRDQLVDLLLLTVSPRLVGGLHAVQDLGQSDVACFPRLKEPACQWLGEDLILWGHLSWGRA